MKRLAFLLYSILFFSSIFGQKQPLNYFLPAQKYNPAIPTPEQFLGFQIGEWHVSHDQIVSYLRELDRVSDRISLETYGYSHEHRPLLLLTITAVENQANLLKIKALHRDLADPIKSKSIDLETVPVVLYQGFSIHGNEASGANAGLLYAYYLAASDSPDMDSILKKTVILYDPCFNPDGGQRFSTWVNATRSTNLVSDVASREFNEPWPRGRFNHYLFDLNRDWLVAQQPESVGRVRIFQDWLPNILTDHHEMGSNSTFFFQPGVPSRVNPLTPPENQEMTRKIGAWHARALDAIGSLYFTEENFDDFYYGKGSTYPDVNGSVGILFEQASSRGHAQDTENGLLTFPFTIRNQLTCALSTLRAGHELHNDLNRYLRDFYQKSAKEATTDPIKTFVFGSKNDPARCSIFVEMLLRHRIEIYNLTEKITADGQVFEPNSAFAIPLNQSKYRLLHGIFDRQTRFSDSLFYDISAWTLPLAFDLENAALKFSPKLGEKLTEAPNQIGHISGDEKSYAWVFRWDNYFAPALTNQLLKENVQIKVGTKPFSLEGKQYDCGTLVIPVAGQTKNATDLFWLLKKAATAWGIEIFGVKTGLTDTGIDLGSQNFVVLKRPRVAILCGDGVQATDAGEAWHLLDTRWAMPPTMLDLANSTNLKTEKYSVAVMPDGNYGALSADRIRDFLNAGGTIVAWGNALKWLKINELASLKFRAPKNPQPQNRRPYHQLDLDGGATTMNGSIFEAEIDRSHPIGFGFSHEKLPVFLSDTLFLEPGANAYSTPLIFSKQPLLAGYLPVSSEKVIGGSAAVVVCGVGRGKIICLAGDPNFRAFWFGTNRLFANAVFFGSIIQNEAAEKSRKRD
jgi:Zinc carboxypeptidase